MSASLPPVFLAHSLARASSARTFHPFGGTKERAKAAHARRRDELILYLTGTFIRFLLPLK